MTILHIEHPVPDFDRWKQAFDSDPIDRRKAGVVRYQVARPADNARYVIIDLYFNTPGEAANALVALKNLWGQVEGTVMTGPRTTMLDVVESVDL